MKRLKVGVIGGMGYEAGIEFFNAINADYRTDESHACRVAYLNGTGESPIKSLVNSAESLFDMGANRVVMACNTAHAVHGEIIDNISAKYRDSVLHLVNTTLEHTKGKRALWLGTSVLAHNTNLIRRGDIRLPNDNQQGIIQSAIWDAKKGLYNNAATIREICKNNVVIAGCTEMPQILRNAGIVNFINPVDVLKMQLSN